MADWVRWALGIGAVPVVTWAAWLTHRVQTHHQTLYGPTDSNGLRGDVAGLKREVYGEGALDSLMVRARHGARNAMQVPLTELEGRLVQIEARVREAERAVDRLTARNGS